MEFPLEVIQLIATNVKTNIRELEGAYTKVRAFASLNQQPVTMELARKALKDLDMGSTTEKVITVDAIQELVAAQYKIRVEDLKAKKRTRSIAYPRQIAMYLTRELTDLSENILADGIIPRFSTPVKKSLKIRKHIPIWNGSWPNS